jgi:hypothetical protein
MGIPIREYWHAAFVDLFRSMLPEQNGKPFVSYVAHDFLGVSATCIPSPQVRSTKAERTPNFQTCTDSHSSISFYSFLEVQLESHRGRRTGISAAQERIFVKDEAVGYEIEMHWYPILICQ